MYLFIAERGHYRHDLQVGLALTNKRGQQISRQLFLDHRIRAPQIRRERKNSQYNTRSRCSPHNERHDLERPYNHGILFCGVITSFFLNQTEKKH